MLVVLCLLPNIAKAQWTFDITSVEAYINDHKQQRSLLLARSTLEASNKLLHNYSMKETVSYKELNADLDKYTRAFDVIDVMYQSLRTVLNVKSTYENVSERIGDYKRLLEDFNEKVVKRKHIELADTVLLSINYAAIRNIAKDGEQLYKSVNDLVLVLNLYRQHWRTSSHADVLQYMHRQVLYHFSCQSVLLQCLVRQFLLFKSILVHTLILWFDLYYDAKLLPFPIIIE